MVVRKDRFDEEEEDFYEALYTQSQAAFGSYVQTGALPSCCSAHRLTLSPDSEWLKLLLLACHACCNLFDIMSTVSSKKPWLEAAISG